MTGYLKQCGNRILKTVFAHNYRKGNFREIYWVFGDGRSGTTWVADLVNFRGTYRKMFEPFHPQLVKQVAQMAMHQYVRQNASDHFLEQVSDDIFSGRFFDQRVDSRNRSFVYDGIVIKDIYCNLMAKWACSQFPQILPVMVIRNPFAVALSKQKKSDWLWLHDPKELLNQEDLVEDYLSPFQDLILRTSSEGDFISRQILIWSILHAIPATQFPPDTLDVVFYENVYRNPSSEILPILKQSASTPDQLPQMLPDNIVQRPTRSAGKDSHIMLGSSPVASWKNELSVRQIEDGMHILAAFGLDNIYGEGSEPVVSGRKFLERQSI